MKRKTKFGAASIFPTAKKAQSEIIAAGKGNNWR